MLFEDRSSICRLLFEDRSSICRLLFEDRSSICRPCCWLSLDYQYQCCMLRCGVSTDHGSARRPAGLLYPQPQRGLLSGHELPRRHGAALHGCPGRLLVSDSHRVVVLFITLCMTLHSVQTLIGSLFFSSNSA